MKFKLTLTVSLASSLFLLTAFSFTSTNALACARDQAGDKTGTESDSKCSCTDATKCEHHDGDTCKAHHKGHMKNANGKMHGNAKYKNHKQMKAAVEPIETPNGAGKDSGDHEGDTKKAEDPAAPTEAQPAKK